MAWEGYWEYAGTEIINASRVEAYCRHSGWFKPIYENDALPYLLADQPYSDPLQDDPPWADPDDPATYEFYGVYPLDVTGVEDSTRTSTVAESILDGGIPGRIRHATKAVNFNVVLVGSSQCGVEAGFQWLKRALLGNACGPGLATGSCAGEDLCYLSCDPAVDASAAPTDPVLASAYFDACMDPYLRSLHRVVVNSGPVVTSKSALTDGSCAWAVTFTAVAGKPWEYGTEVPFIAGFMNPAVANPWPSVVVPDGASYDPAGSVLDDPPCAEPVWAPVNDPLCVQVVPPPTVPDVRLVGQCYDPPHRWRRREFTIPEQYVPTWQEVCPVVTVNPISQDCRNLRLRFYAQGPYGGTWQDDPCSYCGDLVVSYVPLGLSLTIDCADEQVYLDKGGGVRQAVGYLVHSADGGPFDWVRLSCGFGYVVTVDLPNTDTPPSLDLSLVPRSV